MGAHLQENVIGWGEAAHDAGFEAPPRSLADRLFGLAPLVYLCLALPLVLFHAFAAPPFQSPDEENHFLRVVQLSHGAVVGQRGSETSAGGVVEVSASLVAHAFDYLKFKPDVKVDLSEFHRVRGVPWNSADQAYASFGNTVIYPPFLYAPAILSVLGAKAAGLSVVDSLYAARLATGLTAVAIAAAALGLAAHGRALLFAVLSLPMALGLFGACTQDALQIALAALVVGAWSRAAERGADVAFPARLAAALALGAVVAARMPFAPLLLLLVLPLPGRAEEGRTNARANRERLAALLLAASIAALWTAFGAGPAKVPFRPDDGVSIGGQLAHLVRHPGATLFVAWTTLRQFGYEHATQFVGWLGWLDTRFPPAYYATAGLVLLAALAADAASGRRAYPAATRAATALIALAAIGAVYGTLYLAWTPVGHPFVDGVQGRYLIVPVLVASLAIPSLAAGDPASPGPIARAMRLGGWIALYAFALANLWFVPTVILTRYYG